MNVKFIKLVTGEDILCDLTIENDRYYLRKPVILIPVNANSMSMIPWPMMSKHENDIAEIQSSHVVLVSNVEENIRREYEQSVTGIVTPRSGELVTPRLTLTED